MAEDDRELLELAANAAGYDDAKFQDMEGWGEVRYGLSQAMWSRKLFDETGEGYWNPLVDDGAALRLAMTLKLNILQGDFSVAVNDEGEVDECLIVGDSGERAETVRRAIVRAAAALAKESP
jgi:hypothetical protein